MSDSELAGFALGLAAARMYDENAEPPETPKSDSMTKSDLVLLLGKIYLAICSTMTPATAEMADRMLIRFADDPKTPPEQARALRIIARGKELDATEF